MGFVNDGFAPPVARSSSTAASPSRPLHRPCPQQPAPGQGARSQGQHPHPLSPLWGKQWLRQAQKLPTASHRLPQRSRGRSPGPSGARSVHAGWTCGRSALPRNALDRSLCFSSLFLTALGRYRGREAEGPAGDCARVYPRETVPTVRTA
uniref:Uncharacterized protein n=1 Tax=Mustela putorius furo TaxID=9669 RepID=M3XSZ3_MUSPF